MNQETKEVKVQTVFEIPEMNMFMLSQKIEALNKKAKRLKCPPIETRILASETRRVGQSILLDGDYKVIYFDRKFFTVEILGASPVLPGWKFLGTLQHEEAGNIVRSVPGFEIPDVFRHGKQKCDHCQKVRRRKDTYIVQKDNGEVKQIGHNCIRDFLGHVSPQALALFATFLKEIENSGEEGFGGSGGGGAYSVSLTSFLQRASQLILNQGFVSRSASQAYAEKSGGEGNLRTTADLTWEHLFPGNDLKKKMANNPEEFKISDDAIRLAEETFAWVKALEIKSNYEHNLKITLLKDYITQRDSGLAASAVSAYQRFIGKEVEREKKAKYGENSKHFGEMGKRDTFELTVIGTNVFESQFAKDGLTLFRMQDVAGNIAVWFSGTGSLEIGKTYKLKATVKRHDEYKGVNQTVLSRCTVIEAPDKEVQQ